MCLWFLSSKHILSDDGGKNANFLWQFGNSSHQGTDGSMQFQQAVLAWNEAIKILTPLLLLLSIRDALEETMHHSASKQRRRLKVVQLKRTWESIADSCCHHYDDKLW